MPDTPVIGIDYDGVLADTNAAKSAWIRTNLGLEVPPWQCDRTSCVPLIGAEAYDTMGDVVYEQAWSRRAPPVPGAVEALAALARRATVHVVTARLPHRLAYVRDWLERHGALARLRGVTSSHGKSKARCCRELGIDVLIDDDERHLVKLPSTGTRPILFRPGSPETGAPPPGVVLCRSWDEILTCLWDR